MPSGCLSGAAGHGAGHPQLGADHPLHARLDARRAGRRLRAHRARQGPLRRRVVLKHALRNALVPIVTVLGLTVALMIGGAVVTETVFGLPGVGNLVVSAVLRRDYPGDPGRAAGRRGDLRADQLRDRPALRRGRSAREVLGAADDGAYHSSSSPRKRSSSTLQRLRLTVRVAIVSFQTRCLLDPRLRGDDDSVRADDGAASPSCCSSAGCSGALVLAATVCSRSSCAALSLRSRPYDPTAIKVLRRLKPPSADNWFGTDELGRDLFSRASTARAPRSASAPRWSPSRWGCGTLLGLRGRLLPPARRPADARRRRDDVLPRHPAGDRAGRGPRRLALNVVLALVLVYTPRVARVVRASTLVVRELPVRRGGARARRLDLAHPLRPHPAEPHLADPGAGHLHLRLRDPGRGRRCPSSASACRRRSRPGARWSPAASSMRTRRCGSCCSRASRSSVRAVAADARRRRARPARPQAEEVDVMADLLTIERPARLLPHRRRRGRRPCAA